MRPNEYESRNKLQPGRIKNPSRYVLGRLHSHKRPVDLPMLQEPDDDPEFRGLTTDDDTTQ